MYDSCSKQLLFSGRPIAQSLFSCSLVATQPIYFFNIVLLLVINTFQLKDTNSSTYVRTFNAGHIIQAFNNSSYLGYDEYFIKITETVFYNQNILAFIPVFKNMDRYRPKKSLTLRTSNEIHYYYDLQQPTYIPMITEVLYLVIIAINTMNHLNKTLVGCT